MNIIEVPSNHEVFSKEFSGSLEKFIYDEFGIILKTKSKVDIGLYVFFEKGFAGTQIHLTMLNNKPLNREVYYNIYLNQKNNDGLDIMCNVSEFRYLNIGHDLAQLALRIMLFIMSAPRKRTQKMKLHKEKSNEINSEKKNKTLNKENKIFLLDEIVEFVQENGLDVGKKLTHTINCPCWSVRGHYRHYKSGKVVFVENYKKGKERHKTEPKDKIYTV